MDSAALILGLFIGGIGVYMMMVQQKILALARVPQHIATFHNIKDNDAGTMIKSFQRAGYSIDRESFKRNRFSGNFEFTMKLAV